MKKILLLSLCCACSLAHAQTLTVLAAASLSDAFKDLNTQFRKHHPQHSVRMSTGGSNQLVQQVIHGVPADIIATADEHAMKRAQEAKVVDTTSRRHFASNVLTLVAPKDSAVRVQKLTDLQNPRIRSIALSNPELAPVGRYSRQVLQAAQVYDALKPKYRTTQNVRESLNHVAKGLADVGFVYRTDAQSPFGRQHVRMVQEIPTLTPIRYPIAIISKSQAKDAAAAYIQFVCSAQGQKILRQYGFQSKGCTP